VAEFSRNLNGSNCTVGGQTIISLSATEDIDADYDTASAVCLAPGGPHAKGAIVQTKEGGVSTGYWHIDEVVTPRSGQRTWRSTGGAAFDHLPLYQYRMRRKGWLAARATLGPMVLGRENFPPRWVPFISYQNMVAAMTTAIGAGSLTWQELWATTAGMRPVGSAEDIIRQICAWVGLPVTFKCQLPVLAPEYSPVNKPAISALREVASWSGASVMLNRNGTIVIYDWQDTFSRGGSTVPMPAALLESEEHDAIPSVNAVTVVGTDRWWAAQPATWNTETMSFDGGGFGWATAAVEVTESIARADNEWPVEQRIEISDYFITPDLARRLAREQLSRAALEAGVGNYRGPAEGSQAICPVTSHCFSVSRSLEWDGSKYRYEIDITGPRSSISWPDEGWDF
jgi:hypothetical protein